MCLGVPGRVQRWIDRDPLTGLAEIDFGGVRRTCHMACVPEAIEGDFVLVHAGVALTIVDAEAARRTLEDLERLTAEPSGESTP
ncbi:HypC/HybG/HupF family hydrogenase formation chaperone [Planctellipticum variicoloris]|uniref:HypC/HybG/HupF family hydrogenase formation chaperone n=1 Tax=Planctellipticum variicoloris TaxID=3064265 RepID=UPI002B5515A2|nr:HypC/HybG/HupF family hydrogenase formation chaperone [Planctomycetaceae bacterium SH412]HTN03217.1 HypC/HybG/HupF family hydrogenase formation chaperone [Planctomycetaceae bacterium]